MTEKNYNPEMKGRNSMEKQKHAMKMDPNVQTPKTEEKTIVGTETQTSEKGKEEKKAEEKKTDKKKQIVEKKTEAVARGQNVPISIKHSIAICKFIKGKTVDKAIADLQQVMVGKKVLPMKGEIPHRRGDVMSGRYPKEASKHFITILKGLKGNASVNGIDNEKITFASATNAFRPHARFGMYRKKRTNLILKIEEKKENKSKINKEKAKEKK